MAVIEMKGLFSKAMLYAAMLSFTAAVCLALIFGFFAYRAYENPLMRSVVHMEGDFPFERDDELGFVPAKDASTLRSHLDSGLRYRVFTDHRGARVDSPGHRTPHRVDVVVVGGSYSWGHGVENADTYAERLREKTGVSVANFAVPSYGTLQSLQILKRNLDLKPKVIIYAFIEDHMKRNLAPCASSYSPYCLPVSHVGFDDNNRPLIRPPLKEYFSLDLNQKYYEEILMKEKFGLNDVLWRMKIDLFNIKERKDIGYRRDPLAFKLSMYYLIGEMARTAKGNNARLMVVHIPYLFDFETSMDETVGVPPAPDKINPPLKELTSAVNSNEGIIFLDLTPAIKEYYGDKSRPALFLEFDGHPNALAHEIIADKIEEALIKEGVLQAILSAY